MGVIKPRDRRCGAYFGCGGAACLGLIFWAIVTCCLLLAAISLMYAIGGLAMAPHLIGGNGIDPELLRLLDRWFPNMVF